MKKSILISLSLAFAVMANAQNIYMTKTGKVSFYSRAKSPEKVEADNIEVSSVINTQTVDMALAILMKIFHFVRSLM